MVETSAAQHLPAASAAADPRQNCHNPAAQQAMERIVAALAGGRVVALVGLPGVGKSELLKTLAAAPEAAATLYRPGKSPTRSPPAGTLLVDDAHRLPETGLAALLARRQGLVLAGPYGLLERLSAAHRRLAIIDLPPLGPEDRESVLHDMLDLAGEPASLLPPSAMAALGRQSAGRIGPLLAMAKLSIFLARLEGSDAVRLNHVEQAGSVGEGVDLADEAPAEPPPQAQPRRAGRAAVLIAAATMAVALAATPALLWHHASPPHPQSAPHVSPTTVADAPPAGSPSAPSSAEAQALPAAILNPAPPPPTRLAALPALFVPATPPPPLPVVPFRVVLHVPPADPVAFHQGDEIAARLRAQGYTVIGPEIAPFWKTPAVTYYFSQDQAAATAIAAALDNRLGPARQLTRETDLPPPGQADIMLANSWRTPRQHARVERRPAYARTPTDQVWPPFFAARAISGAWRWVGRSLQ